MSDPQLDKEFARPHSAAEYASLRKAFDDCLKELIKYATRAGEAEGKLLAIGWQGGPEKVVEGFSAENERLRTHVRELEERLESATASARRRKETAREIIRGTDPA